MKKLVIFLKGLGIILLGFVVIILVNLPHDLIINSVDPGSAKNNVPLSGQAEWISIAIVFVAGVLASTLVCTLAGRRRNALLLILGALFLIADLFGVFTSLSSTSIFYRISMIVMIPFEVGLGFLLGKQLTGNKKRG